MGIPFCGVLSRDDVVELHRRALELAEKPLNRLEDFRQLHIAGGEPATRNRFCVSIPGTYAANARALDNAGALTAPREPIPRDVLQRAYNERALSFMQRYAKVRSFDVNAFIAENAR